MSPLQRLIDSHSPVSETPQPEEAVQREPDVASEQMLESPVQRQVTTTGENPSENPPNSTGLPTQLKAGVENLSGYSLDDVKVHYNSPKPAQLKALAYTKGTDIHVAPGQEQHLPHEAWHVVQQKQGRVKGTKQAKGNELINDDPGLEREADMMGAKAMQTKSLGGQTAKNSQLTPGIVQMRGRLENIEATDKPRLVLKIVLPGSKDDEYRSWTKEKETMTKQVRTAWKLWLGTKTVDDKEAQKEYIRKKRGVRGSATGDYGDKLPAHWYRIKGTKHQLTVAGPGAKTAEGGWKGLRDSGSNKIAKNVAFVPTWVKKQISEYESKRKEDENYEVIILIKAHSRNAVAGTKIANALAEMYPDPSVKIELVANDPVPGPWQKNDYHNITLNEKITSTVVYSIASGYSYTFGGFKPKKVYGAKRLIISLREHDVGMHLGFYYENKLYKGSDINTLPLGVYFDLPKNTDSIVKLLKGPDDYDKACEWVDFTLKHSQAMIRDSSRVPRIKQVLKEYYDRRESEQQKQE